MAVATKPKRILSGHFCECGCGKETYLAYHRNGHHVPGEPLRFRPGHYLRDMSPSQLYSLREWMKENLTEEQLDSLWSDYCVE